MTAAKRKPSKKQKRQLIPDADLGRLHALLAKKQEYVAVLELELTNTRADLNNFTEIYNQRIGPLHWRANRLRKLLYDALEIQRENEKEKWPEFPGVGPDANKPDDDAAFPEDEWRQNRNPRQKLNGGDPNGKAERRDPQREERIRDLFRNLAKRFHPDLTADPDEKKQREQIMARVNQAYAARDLEDLLKLAEAPDIEKVNGSLSQAKQISHIRVELERLDLVITELENTIRQIDSSPIMHLRLEMRLARRDGKDLLSDMSNDLDVQIQDLEEHLTVLGVEIEEEPEE